MIVNGSALHGSQESAGGDDLVNAAADSLAEAASVGVPTRVQLINRFDKVVSSAGKLVLMPEGCGGIVATALSAIAGETAAEAGCNPLQATFVMLGRQWRESHHDTSCVEQDKLLCSVWEGLQGIKQTGNR